MHAGLEKKRNSVCCRSFLTCLVILKCPISDILWHCFDLSRSNFPQVKLALTIQRNVGGSLTVLLLKYKETEQHATGVNNIPPLHQAPWDRVCP